MRRNYASLNQEHKSTHDAPQAKKCYTTLTRERAVHAHRNIWKQNTKTWLEKKSFLTCSWKFDTDDSVISPVALLKRLRSPDNMKCSVFANFRYQRRLRLHQLTMWPTCACYLWSYRPSQVCAGWRRPIRNAVCFSWKTVDNVQQHHSSPSVNDVITDQIDLIYVYVCSCCHCSLP